MGHHSVQSDDGTPTQRDTSPSKLAHENYSSCTLPRGRAAARNNFRLRNTIFVYERNPVYLRILAYLVIYDSGQVSLEHLLLSRHPSQRGPASVINLAQVRPHGKRPLPGGHAASQVISPMAHNLCRSQAACLEHICCMLLSRNIEVAHYVGVPHRFTYQCCLSK